MAQAAAAWRSTSAVEWVAAVLAVAYLVLAIRQRVTCWGAAFASSCLYVWVMFGAHLYMESALNAFYAAMAVYGYRQWAAGGRRRLAVSHWRWIHHVTGLLAIVVLSLLSSVLLKRFTPAAWPFVDSMTTWSSVFATFLVARKIYENWYWWFVIDAVCLGLYVNRGLYLTALLFALYLAMIIVGMREWRRDAGPPVHGAQHA